MEEDEIRMIRKMPKFRIGSQAEEDALSKLELQRQEAVLNRLIGSMIKRGEEAIQGEPNK